MSAHSATFPTATPRGDRRPASRPCWRGSGSGPLPAPARVGPAAPENPRDGAAAPFAEMSAVGDAGVSEADVRAAWEAGEACRGRPPPVVGAHLVAAAQWVFFITAAIRIAAW